MIFSLFKSKSKKGLPALRLHNTLSGRLEEFVPLGKEIKMYNCGPTVYDYVHIGNLRSYVFADTIRRTLDAWGYTVKQVINITDFGHLVSDADEGDDKMTKGLQREGLDPTMENMRILAERYTKAFLHDIELVGVDTARVEFPRASAYIEEQIALIKTLEQKGYAYRLSDGVYFDTSRFPNYGKLGHRDIAAQKEGARLEQNKEKRNPSDFVLWKSDSKLGWQSPWDLGFPGWHIECTAMIFKLLGKQIDIHTGGIDHVSIHHNNEIAQAEAVTGKKFVRYWMHGEFITVENRRVGKSQGNAILLSSLTDRGMFARALRYWYLTGHYLQPMNFTWEALEGANAALVRLAKVHNEAPDGEPDEKFLQLFYGAVANDLNTPQALALVWENIKNLNKATLAEADKILGLGLAQVKPAQKLQVARDELSEGVRALLDTREAARQKKDFQKADEIRGEIESAGYTLKDTPEGPYITKKG
ncbi:MAG: cysteine--tRNA ligase [Patescibacteria group bacterium]